MATPGVSGSARWTSRGIDLEALSINPYWYKTDRDVARQIMKIQNEKLAEACATTPTGCCFATVALQHPDSREQLEGGRQEYGCAAPASRQRQRRGDQRPEVHRSGRRRAARRLVFIHPQGSPELNTTTRLKGNGYLDNVIANPLETTIALSHLIFEGTLDRFPGSRSARRTAGASCRRRGTL